MSTADVMGIVPLLHGDEIHPRDARILIQSVHSDPAFRAACKALGHMTHELDAGTRQERFRSCLSLLLSGIKPPPPADSPEVILSPGFLSRHRILPGYWRRHLEIKYQKETRKVTAAFASKVLAERIAALQDFWGLPDFAVSFK